MEHFAKAHSDIREDIRNHLYLIRKYSDEYHLSCQENLNIISYLQDCIISCHTMLKKEVPQDAIDMRFISET
jgi:hypothetical protein